MSLLIGVCHGATGAPPRAGYDRLLAGATGLDQSFQQRRGRDSNPRTRKPPVTRFPVALLKPARTPLLKPQVCQPAVFCEVAVVSAWQAANPSPATSHPARRGRKFGG